MRILCIYVLGMALAFGGLFAPTSMAADSINDLDFLTENYAPFNFEKNGKVQGISVDILAVILEKTGSTKTIKDIRLLPWTVGYNAVQREKNTMLFVTTRTEAREHMFKWVGPIIPSSISVIARKDRNIIIDTPQDLNRYKIGAVRDDVAQMLLLERSVSPGNIYETVSGTGGENLGRMLAAGRIDLWAYAKVVAIWNLRELGYSSSDFETVFTLKDTQLYFALNKNTDAKIVAQLQAALDEIRASGKLKEIIRSYLPGF